MLALLIAAATFTPSATVHFAQARVTVRIVGATKVSLTASSSDDRLATSRETTLVVDGVAQPARLVEFN